jgi:hypothetical protein
MSIGDLPAFVLKHIGDHHLGAFAREHTPVAVAGQFGGES